MHAMPLRLRNVSYSGVFAAIMLVSLAYPGTATGQALKSDSVVKVSAKAEPEKPGADLKQEVTVTLDIARGWHVYANPVGLDDLNTSQTVVKVASKHEFEKADISYPKGQEVNDPVLGKYRVLDGKVTISAKVKRAAGDSSPLEVSVKFQACNDRQCLVPATKKLTIP